MSILLSLSRFFGLSSHDWDFGLGLDLDASPAAEPEVSAPQAAAHESEAHEGAPHAGQRRELYGMAAAIHSLYQDGVGFDANDRR
jgi:hypothetical protein